MSETNSPVPPVNLFRRKKGYRRGITYTLLLLGKSGTGKTTFANNLLESNIFSHQFNQVDTKDFTVSPRIKIIKPTKVVSFNSKNGIPSYMADFDPSRAQLESGVTITSTSLEILTGSDENDENYDDNDDNILFNLVNTYGVDENLDDSLCFDEISSYLEQQFDIVLSEETRIKRNPRFEDTRVHIALYFIEPTGHGLKELDIELMKKVSRYTNVLPIITKADSFTKEELKQFKANVMQDIEAFNVPVYKFEVDPDNDNLEAIEENEALASLQPFAVICSDILDSDGKYIREYPWGKIKIDDEKVSDLRILKSVLFGSHLQEFKDTTQNLLYENYRSEKLSTVTRNDSIEPAEDKRASAAPSLSNFASLINTGSFKSQQSLAFNSSSNDVPSTPEMRIKEEDEYDSERGSVKESPIKQLSDEIRNENEEIIRSIKKGSAISLPLKDSTDRSKLRNISETVPYVLRHERILARQQKLEELEAQSAKELQKRIIELERKAQELKLKERLLETRNSAINNSSHSLMSSGTVQSQLKKGDTFTDLASIVSGKN
ncbi:hypothetical protein KAFR_0F00280 [Kazachstania africana CBS 2517]|uniref:Septin-type G domain-containing protein n=1 Tax=Kazachstania africana (strain ATCC 22294 / BCRC 22015 / CBS 2517 / CECT 1963 / NBRC 1671 / NRRL Y-8276) TaxID=1071382 RepID=H2AW75_KAZAF|nr:hypothetical protein KAFR_0F00280 [Kazachstania africana CBS 2517]CCF58625.1 hypothetical protein KAFR_0F00280 [Kazachstania africana CBS 2517]